MKVHNLSIILYITSLAIPVISDGGSAMYGLEILTFGILGIPLLLSGLLNGDILEAIGMLFLLIPWIANFTWLTSIILIIKGKTNSSITKKCSYFSLAAVLLFYIRPLAPIGADAGIVEAQILPGNFLWLFAIILPFLSTWLADESIDSIE